MSPDDRRCDPSPVVQWIGWHLGELAGVALPLVLAVTVTAWIALIAVAVAGCWAVQEIRVHRRRRALTTGPARPGVTAPEGVSTSHDTKEASA